MEHDVSGTITALPAAARSTRLTRWGGLTCVAIGLGHSVIGLAVAGRHWPGWITGDLWWGIGSPGMLESKLAFWSVPGSFVVPLILLGLMAVGRAREGRALPGYVGWTMLTWAAFGAYIGFPTGFLLVLVPATLFILDGRRRAD
ncbi:DUF6463 family protein [Stackebrandtia soli]|uniref:DUF6463 family protein n=1 Tax=Stackebrandtia soli TaxID=1892856 RepID=UPI0039EA9429